MSSSNMALIELVFSAVVVIGFCVWQLISVNRDIRARKEREAQLNEAPRDPSADK